MSRDKLKTLYLLSHKTYTYQIWKMLTYVEGLSLRKSYVPLIIRSRNKAQKNKHFSSPLPQSYKHEIGFPPTNPFDPQLHGHKISSDTLETSLPFFRTFVHQNFRDQGLEWGASGHQVILTFHDKITCHMNNSGKDSNFYPTRL